MQQHRRLVSVKEVRAEFGVPLSYTQLKRKMAEVPPTFPLCVKLGRHANSRVAWYADEVSEFVESLEATRG